MTAEPKDRYNSTYFVFYLLGLGSLLPWNFFITADQYWMYKFRNTNVSTPITVAPAVTTMSILSSTYNDSSTIDEDDDLFYTTDATATTHAPHTPVQYSELQKVWGNALSICAMLPNIIFQFLNTILQRRIRQNVRIMGTLALMILLFIVTEIFVKVNTDDWQNLFFTLSLLLVVVINSCSAIFQSSVFGLAACFPQKYCGAVMAGQGIGGVFAALAMIIALTVSSDSVASAFIFFLTAIIVIGLTMIFYTVMLKMDFYKHYSHFTHTYSPEKGDKEECVPINGDASDYKENGEKDNVWVASGDSKPNAKIINVDPDDNKALMAKETEFEQEQKFASDGQKLWFIVKKVKVYAFCVTYTFFVTLACFPAITAKINPMWKTQHPGEEGSAWIEYYFTPVCCFLLFNVTDWIGRSMASYIHIPSEKHTTALVLCVLGRTAFMFLFALCNVQPRSIPVIFQNDGFFILFMTLFGISNGHLSTLCMQYGPKLVKSEHAPMAGSFLAFMISVGLFAGAGFSFVLTMAI